MTNQKKVLIIGVGAVGASYGWRIQQGGAAVSVICRSNYNAVLNNGIQIISDTHGDGLFKPEGVYANCEDSVADGAIYDYVLVCTKSLPNIVDPAEQIQPCILSTKTVIVLVQNGIGIEAPFVKLFPENPLISSIAYISSVYHDNNVAQYTAYIALEHSIHKSDHSALTKEDHQAVQEFHKLLSSGGIESRMSNNLQKTRWRKLVINACFNPLSVLTGGHFAKQMLMADETHQLCIDSMKEIVRIAEADLNEPLYDIPVDEAIGKNVKMLSNDPRQVESSTLKDYMKKRPMEHEVIIKNAIDIAKKHQIEVPILQTVYALLVLKEIKNFKKSEIEEISSRI